MPSSTLQFFAASNELIEFARDIHHSIGSWAIRMEYLPTFSLEVKQPRHDFGLTEDKLARTRRICFTLAQPCVQCESPYEFVIKNPNCLVFDFGQQDDTGLRESAIGFKTDNAECVQKWKLVAKKIKSKTKAGLWVTSAKNSVSAFYKNLRFTPGAAALADEGKRLLPLGAALVASVAKPGK